MGKLWNKLPAFIKALLIGALLFFPAISIIQVLLFQNLARYSQLPWSFPLVLVLLWLYWRFTTGADKPFKPSADRKNLSMSKLDLSGNLAWIIISIIGLILFTYSAVCLGYVFVDEDTDQFEMIKLFIAAPPQTAIVLVLGLSLTAGIIEEVVFRGYVQTILERHYGIIVSILSTAVIFALLHFLPAVLIFPYIMVSMAFSFVAFKNRTIVPGVIAHATFDFIAIMLIYYHPIMVTQEFFEGTIFLNLILCVLSIILLWYSQRKIEPIVYRPAA